MGDEIQNLLKEVVDGCGIYESAKPGRCFELLSQHYGALKEDFLLLSKAAEYGIVEDLIRLRHRYRVDSVGEILSSRLMVRMNISQEMTQWLVSSWAYALNISGT